MSQYIPAAATAKLLRQALKESFPGVKFSVRSKSYSGGGSINVNWTDGPNSAQVKSITDLFEGAYFDGMIDYKGSRFHKLDGEPVHFGANFIFTNRECSDAAVERAIGYLKAKYPGNFRDMDITAAAYRNGDYWNVQPFGGTAHYNSLQNIVRRAIAKRSDRFAPEKSKTLVRVEFAGDDGYGAGTVGRDGSGGESCYKAVAAARAAAEAMRGMNS